MKIEIDDKVLINTIVEKVIEKIAPLLNHNSMSKDNQLWDIEKVVERLKPLFSNSHDPKGDELMDVKALASYLKVKESWIYEKIHKREIPFNKCGKFPRFRRKHIDIWLENPYSSKLDNYNLNHKKGGD